MNKATTYNLPSVVVIGCRLVLLAIPSWSCLPGIICVRILNRLTRCTVLTPLPLNFCHIPNGIPLAEQTNNFPIFGFHLFCRFYRAYLASEFSTFIYRFLPDSNRNEILSRSNCAQLESVAIIIGAKRDGCSSSSNKVSCSF